MEILTPDAGPPFAVRRMPSGPTHIVARDGFTIIATINQDVVSNAETLAVAPELLEAAREAAVLSTGALRRKLDAAIAKAEGK